MKAGAENRRKTIMAGALGAGALVCVFVIYNQLFSGPDTPAPTPTTSAPVKATVPTSGAGNSRASTNSSNTAGQPENLPAGAAPGVEAQKLASSTASLDPTLDQAAMLRTESLVYSGTGRNIFSATYTPAVATKPYTPPPAPPVRQTFTAPVNTGPVVAPLPPINLKFFGTATRSNGAKQAFLLSGDDVYLASQGDIVARKYKIGAISTNSISVTDLTNNNTQTLPLQMN